MFSTNLKVGVLTVTNVIHENVTKLLNDFFDIVPLRIMQNLKQQDLLVD